MLALDFIVAVHLVGNVKRIIVMAKISKFTEESVVSSMTPQEARDCVACLIYARGHFNSYTTPEFRDNVCSLIADFKKAGVID